jgi:hypothetical protein
VPLELVVALGSVRGLMDGDQVGGEVGRDFVEPLESILDVLSVDYDRRRPTAWLSVVAGVRVCPMRLTTNRHKSNHPRLSSIMRP